MSALVSTQSERPTASGDRAFGKAIRKRVPRPSHAAWTQAPDRPHPIAILERDADGRLTELLPLRYRRMAANAFAFFRGAASLMANDVQSTPNTDIRLQICGDAHLANFGAFASPERRIVFDVNDFDETVEGCWEWDIKRLCASVAILGRFRAFRDRSIDAAVSACVRSYRQRMHDFARASVLDVWYARIDETALATAVAGVVADAPNVHDAGRASRALYARTVDETSGKPRIADRPPLVFHPDDSEAFVRGVRDAFALYKRTLAFERRELLRRYTFEDAAYKVVGVGSVGTRCTVMLLLAENDDPLFLQLKEARASVYARYTCDSPFANEGERVVSGQRLMQATSDLFLGWTRAKDGHMYYVRQLRDVKSGVDLETVTQDELTRYAALCGWALARAHAKAGGSAGAIAGYLGSGDAFDRALVAFSQAYADQNERDYRALLAAIESGRIAT